MSERWGQVVGYEGLYLVSSWGNVMTRGFVPVVGHEVNGYRRVSLSKDRKQRSQAVHRMVLAAFVGPCPPRMIGLHRDDDRLNNDLDNLRWGTHQENIADARRNGRGIRMSDDMVRSLRQSGWTDRQLAETHNLSEIAVFNARAGLTYRHVRC